MGAQEADRPAVVSRLGLELTDFLRLTEDANRATDIVCVARVMIAVASRNGIIQISSLQGSERPARKSQGTIGIALAGNATFKF